MNEILFCREDKGYSNIMATNQSVILNIDGTHKLATNINYSELVSLYWKFIKNTIAFQQLMTEKLDTIYLNAGSLDVF